MFFRLSPTDSTPQTPGTPHQQDTASSEQPLHHNRDTVSLPTASTPSPMATSSPSNRMPRTFSGVAKLILNLRRTASTETNSNESPPSSGPSSPAIPSDPSHMPSTSGAFEAAHYSASPPSTPKEKRVKQSSRGSPSSPTSPASPTSPTSPSLHKAQRSESSSGSTPISHPGLAENACERRESVECTDTYVCSGGVNVPILLRTTRTELMDIASLAGANALIDEQWKCTIQVPKSRSKPMYKVQIHYKAHATRSTVADPHQPVALSQTSNIPGLMTVLRRNDD